MKKILCLALAAAMTLSLAACGGPSAASSGSSSGIGSIAGVSSGDSSSLTMGVSSAEPEPEVSSIPEKGSVTFDYGDELTFYKNDEAKSKNPTAISVVKTNLDAVSKNDYKAWLKTLTPARQKALEKKKAMDFGVTSMKIKDVSYEADNRYKYQAINGANGQKNKWTAENLAVVSATYNAVYDPNVVQTVNGDLTVKYLLVRTSATAPWAVQEWNLSFEE